MITPVIVPMRVAVSTVEIPMQVSTSNVAFPMSVGVSYAMAGGVDLPSGGAAGDLLAKRTNSDYDMEWITPATEVEQDNTRPITSAAVYAEVGNINALLATI